MGSNSIGNKCITYIYSNASYVLKLLYYSNFDRRINKASFGESMGYCLNFPFEKVWVYLLDFSI